MHLSHLELIIHRVSKVTPQEPQLLRKDLVPGPCTASDKSLGTGSVLQENGEKANSLTTSQHQLSGHLLNISKPVGRYVWVYQEVGSISAGI